MAAEQVEAFARNAALARGLSRALDLVDLDAALSQAETEFPDDYAAGRAMAAQCIAGGAEAGNAMMAAFDTIAERLDHDLAAGRDAIDATNRMALVLGAVALRPIAVEAMTLIERSSNRIRDIANVIDGIAFKTNLFGSERGGGGDLDGRRRSAARRWPMKGAPPRCAGLTVAITAR